MTRIKQALLWLFSVSMTVGVAEVAFGQVAMFADCPNPTEAGLLSDYVQQAQCLLDPNVGVTVTFKSTQYDNGTDFVATIVNQSNTDTLMLPALRMNGLPLGEDLGSVQYLKQVTDTYFTNFGSDYTSDIRRYPQDLYSPVMIARSADTYVGVSLPYFDLNNVHFQHSVLTKLKHIPSTGWQCSFLLDDVLKPHETRQYHICFRYESSDIGNDWPIVIQPYRDYFWSKYQQSDGSVARYQHSLDPALGFYTSDANALSVDDPRGFTDYRPDIEGFGPMVNRFVSETQRLHYQTTVVWTPGGQYFNNRWCNLPPQMTTGWTSPMSMTAFAWLKFGDPNGDGELSDAIRLMFWWGRAAACPQVSSPLDWDVPCETFDPTDPTQADIMTREWSNALLLGASGVVMDAFPAGAGGVFSSIPSKPAVVWLQHLEDVAASMGVNDPTLVTEQESCDVLNVFAPTLMPSYVNGHEVTTPQYLADYLIPDHETWSLFLDTGTAEQRAQRAADLINLGYRPLLTDCSDCPDRNDIISRLANIASH